MYGNAYSKLAAQRRSSATGKQYTGERVQLRPRCTELTPNRCPCSEGAHRYSDTRTRKTASRKRTASSDVIYRHLRCVTRVFGRTPREVVYIYARDSPDEPAGAGYFVPLRAGVAKAVWETIAACIERPRRTDRVACTWPWLLPSRLLRTSFLVAGAQP